MLWSSYHAEMNMAYSQKSDSTSVEKIWKIKLLKKFLFEHFLLVNISKVTNQQKLWTPLFLYFKFEASLNSVHFPILAYITLSPQNDILSLFSATRLTEFINYLEEWWQKPKIDLEHQNRVPIILCLLQDNVIYITYYTFCSVSMFKYNDDCM